MKQPQGMRDPDYPDHVCRLLKAIYGLKQTPRAWYDTLRFLLLSLGFVMSRADTSMFILQRHHCTVFLLVYMDNLIITGSDSVVVTQITRQLDEHFSTKNLGELSFFSGFEVIHTSTGLLLSQCKYIIDFLGRHNMLTSKPMATPLVVGTSLSVKDRSPSADATLYR